MSLTQLILVFIGGGLGSLGRFLFGWLCLRLLPPHFPFGTLGVNIIGCFVMGLMMGVMIHSTVTTNARVFIVVGILGGFTTFSSFGGDTWTLIRDGTSALAFLYVATSLIAGLLAVGAGMGVYRWVASV